MSGTAKNARLGADLVRAAAGLDLTALRQPGLGAGQAALGVGAPR
ncbi:hypothetical protein HMPREF1979_01963, partial [Actinomyces johnsonii F0542]